MKLKSPVILQNLFGKTLKRIIRREFILWASYKTFAERETLNWGKKTVYKTIWADAFILFIKISIENIWHLIESSLNFLGNSAPQHIYSINTLHSLQRKVSPFQKYSCGMYLKIEGNFWKIKKNKTILNSILQKTMSHY